MERSDAPARPDAALGASAAGRPALRARRAARACWWAILLVAIGLRLALASGYGLGDDPGYFFCYNDILRSGQWSPDRAYDWRFAFWVPVVAFMRVLGVSEVGFVGFVTLCGVLNVVLVWAIARQEWDEPWAPLVAMALMACLPLEVLSSTLFVIDIPLATYCFGAFWLYRAALAGGRRTAARVALAVAAGVALFLSYSAKQWGILIGVLFAVEALRGLRATWRWSVLCAGTFALCMAAYLGWQWARFGDPIRDVHVVRKVAIFLPHSWDIVTDYSRMLLLPNEYGTWFAGWYVHATLLLAVLFVARVRRAGPWLAYFVLQLACLSAMPSHRENGTWVLLVPHIFRYLCFVSIPLCLALAGYARELVAWRPGWGYAAIAGFLALSVGQAVALTAPTRDAFGEQRRANAVLLQRFPDEPYVSDADFLRRLQNFAFGGRAYERFRWLRGEDPASQARELAGVRESVVVTGGARLPWYGCLRCAASLEGFQPGATWHLVATFDGLVTPYRKEPLRIWQVSEAASRAGTLLERTPTPAERLTVLRGLVAKHDDQLAVAFGRRLIDEAVEPATEVAYLTGLACARTRRPRCASTLLDRALAAAPDAGASREALVALAEVASITSDFRPLRAWLALHRERFPAAGPDPALDELASGMTEAIATYHATRYADAERLFARIAADPDEPAERRRRAQYFLALTLFRRRDLARATALAAAYRTQYGDDEASLELEFRQAELRRETDPGAARTLFEALATRHPESFWGQEAGRLAAEIAADPDLVRR